MTLTDVLLVAILVVAIAVFVRLRRIERQGRITSRKITALSIALGHDVSQLELPDTTTRRVHLLCLAGKRDDALRLIEDTLQLDPATAERILLRIRPSELELPPDTATDTVSNREHR